MKAIDNLTAAHEKIEQAIEHIDNALLNTTLESKFGHRLHSIVIQLKEISEKNSTHYTMPEIINSDKWDSSF